MWDFTPWSQRDSEPEPRIHEELTEKARIRISNIVVHEIRQEHVKTAYRHLVDNTGQEIHSLDFSNSSATLRSVEGFIRSEEDLDLLLDFLEYLLNTLWSDEGYYRNNSTLNMAVKIQKALVQEGILIQMKPSPEEMNSYRTYIPSRNEYVCFQQVADETIIETDQELRVLALGDKWKEPLSGYNEAWELYRDDTLTYVITEKLYNSLEAVVQKICIDLEGWENEGATVGTCLNTMREKGLFEPNDTMIGEWQQIYGGLQTGVQKLGSDRKRHEEIDQDYAILLLHQTSAFLTFVIKRYEQKYT